MRVIETRWISYAIMRQRYLEIFSPRFATLTVDALIILLPFFPLSPLRTKCNACNRVIPRNTRERKKKRKRHNSYNRQVLIIIEIRNTFFLLSHRENVNGARLPDFQPPYRFFFFHINNRHGRAYPSISRRFPTLLAEQREGRRANVRSGLLLDCVEPKCPRVIDSGIPHGFH